MIADLMLRLYKRKLSYRFYLHQHPFVQELMQRLVRKGVEGLLSIDTEYREDGKPKLYEEFFPSTYRPTDLVRKPFPVKELDFATEGAYAVYNWELFFHVPFTIALHLSKNGRYAEAQKWFHYIFDPTDDSGDTDPERYWKFHPFREMEPGNIVKVLENLISREDEELYRRTLQSIRAWREKPFRPHLIARFRQWAYMYKVVMAYLDNLIAWGDSLFRQDTPESVDEALQLYIMAANILGPRPQPVPLKGRVRPKTYADLKDEISAFGNALVDLETDLPPDVPSASNGEGSREALNAVRSMIRTLYFCVPPNDKLLSYWDTVADRLFKIRNSLDITGRFRQLPLFSPPIDPALLARATAAGVDVGAVISGLEQPLPLVRFSFLIQKATEICQEVKSLGNQLLSAMEKEESEALSVLRAKHERAILELTEQVRYAQWQEAIKSREALEKSLASAVLRYIYYERQLGRKEGEIREQIKPALEAFAELDRRRLERMEPVEDSDSGVEASLQERPIEVDIANDLFAQVAQFLVGGRILSSYEVREILLLDASQLLTDISVVLSLVSSGVRHVPEMEANVQPLGVGLSSQYGGTKIADSLQDWARALQGVAGRLNFEAGRAARMNQFYRREQEWAFQSNLARGEIIQILKQLRAAQIREAIAELELRNHRRQMKHAEEIERFLNEQGTEPTGKKTNRAFYLWMKREVRGLYTTCFQLAYDVAKRAERALQHELGDPDLSFIGTAYTAGKEGLLAGEKLLLDLKRMEMAYHEKNRREYEITKHVSLRRLNPVALLMLRLTGGCEFEIPEWFFDLDCPGHYFRRIKSVSLSIPAVTGPYTGVNCTLSLLRSSVRIKPQLRGGRYARQGTEDDRFTDYLGTVQSIVTSTASNDSGLFEVNLRDERYLPFEGHGAVSRWRLELPAEFPQFDYSTITDVILHIRYTAREGGTSLKNASVEYLREIFGSGGILYLLLDLRRDFPTEWHGASDGVVNLKLTRGHFPYFTQRRSIHLTEMRLFRDDGSQEVIDGVPEGSVDGEGLDLSVPVGDRSKDAFLVVGYSLRE